MDDFFESSSRGLCSCYKYKECELTGFGEGSTPLGLQGFHCATTLLRFYDHGFFKGLRRVLQAFAWRFKGSHK